MLDGVFPAFMNASHADKAAGVEHEI